MRNMYQCEKCGKVFASYDERYQHEEGHWQVCGWYKRYEKAVAEFTQYSEKQEAPTVIGVELQRWDSEKGVPLDWLNGKIDEYNRSPFLCSTGDFWGWLSWEEGEEFRGLDCLWNKDLSKLHRIKGA